MPEFPSKLREAEREISRIRTHEVAIGFDASGQEIFRKIGDRDEVTFTPDELAQLKGAILTHNHPSGASFSRRDLEVAVYWDLAQIRAVGVSESGDCFLHVIERRTNGWGISHPALLSEYDRSAVQVADETDAAILRGEVGYNEAEREYPHRVITRLAKELGWNYQRIRMS